MHALQEEMQFLQCFCFITNINKLIQIMITFTHDNLLMIRLFSLIVLFSTFIDKIKTCIIIRTQTILVFNLEELQMQLPCISLFIK